MSEDHEFLKNFDLEPQSPDQLIHLCGRLDEHLRQIEDRLKIKIRNRGGHFQLRADDEKAIRVGLHVLGKLAELAMLGPISPAQVHLLIQECAAVLDQDEEDASDYHEIRLRRGVIRARGLHQKKYLQQINEYDLTFGIGPAGTGKTYLAVASAVQALEHERVRRLVLVRPAVEAGEKLGFLPGDLAQKVDPYLRPVYDALYEMLGFDKVAKLLERNVIEVAPLAYMRGRTLNDAFIILDEAQNTTIEQMKMFLTRIGFGSVTVVTGDISQVDLPRQTRSGLRHAIEVLKQVDAVAFSWFKASDVVRHPLVQSIIRAYEAQDALEGKMNGDQHGASE